MTENSFTYKDSTRELLRQIKAASGPDLALGFDPQTLPHAPYIYFDVTERPSRENVSYCVSEDELRADLHEILQFAEKKLSDCLAEHLRWALRRIRTSNLGEGDHFGRAEQCVNQFDEIRRHG